jgi:hypothetical protein
MCFKNPLGLSRASMAGAPSSSWAWRRVSVRSVVLRPVRGVKGVRSLFPRWTDNAAMIGIAGAYRRERGERDPLTLNADATAELD